MLNAMRRETLDALTGERQRQRPRVTGGAIRNNVPYPERELTYLGNVLNRKAEAFYRRQSSIVRRFCAQHGIDCELA
jgi:putative protease